MTSPARPQPARHFGPTGPITWAFLTDEQETEQVKELRLWVEWLVWRFALDHRTIPECWARHGAVVEELSALYTAWQDAYTHSAEATAPSSGCCSSPSRASDSGTGMPSPAVDRASIEPRADFSQDACRRRSVGLEEAPARAPGPPLVQRAKERLLASQGTPPRRGVRPANLAQTPEVAGPSGLDHRTPDGSVRARLGDVRGACTLALAQPISVLHVDQCIILIARKPLEEY